MADHHFPKSARLLRGSDFERVFAARASASDRWLVVYGAESGRDHPRLGLAVSRRQGAAVTRNRWKRLLREAFRLTQGQLPALDLVCVPKAKEIPDCSQLVASFPQLAARVEQKLRSRRAKSPPAGEPKEIAP